MKNILKNIGGALFEDDANLLKQTRPEVSVQATSPAVSVAAVASAISALAATPTQSDYKAERYANSEAVQKLRATIGPPATSTYAAFLRISASLKQFIPDDAARYQATKATLASQSATIRDVIAELKAALDRLKIESSKILAGSKSATEREIAPREKRLRELGEQLSKIQYEMQQVGAELVAQKESIDSKLQELDGAVAALEHEYKDEIAKLEPIS